MKKTTKVILIIILIVILFLWWLFAVRTKRSNELKSWLLIEDSNWIIQQVVWGWNDLSINVNWPQTALRIPISSVVPETLTWKNFKFRLNLYDENWEKLDYVFLGEKGIPSWVSHSPVVDLIFKDSILWMKEFKMPLWAISRINEDTFQVELEDFDWYADMAWDDIRYKIFGKWKIDSVYLEIFHWNNVKLEFSILDENEQNIQEQTDEIIDKNIEIEDENNDEKDENQSEILDHLDSKILIDIESLQTPKFEEIDEIVAICPFELLGWWYIEWYDEYNQTRRSFLLPYKDWFIWYELRWQEWAQFILTYRLKSDPCNRISYSDEIFWRNQYYNPVERRSGLEYPDDKIYISQWLWSWIPTDTIVKNLDCVSWENQKWYWSNANCRKKAEQYFYNLFIWIEQNEYFTKRMDDFKKNIDNWVFTTSGFRVWRNNTCSEKVKSGIWEVQPTDSEEIRQNYIKLKNEKMHECAMEYFK